MPFAESVGPDPGTGSPRPPRLGVERGALLLLLIWAPLPLASNRPWSAALLVLLLTGLAAVAAARGARVPWTGATRVAMALVGLVLAWVLLQAVPLPGGADRWPWAGLEALTGRPPWGSLSQTPEATMRGALQLAGYAVAVWLGAALSGAAPAPVRRAVVRTLAGLGTVLAVYALAVLASGTQTILWLDKWTYHDVATATFVNRNAYCVYAGIGIAAALLAAGDAGTRRGRRVWQAAAVPGLMAALLTESRWGLASVVAGLLALAWLRPGPPPWRSLAVGLGIAGALPVILVLTGQDRLLSRLAPARVLGDLRWDLYRVTLEAIAAAPWTGHGPGSFPVVYQQVRDPALGDALVRQAHAVPLDLAVELGAPAALALMAAFGLLVLGAIRRARRTGESLARLGAAAGIMAGLHALLDFSMQIPALAVTVLVLLGAASAGPPWPPWPASAATPPGPVAPRARADPAPPPAP